LPAVSDAGPLIHLSQIKSLNLLEGIFGKITITPSVRHEVVDEGIRLGYRDALLVKDALTKGDIILAKLSPRLVRRATRLAKQERISLADSYTLMLAKQLGQPPLTDEKILSTLAKMCGVEVWNTWTILLEALRIRLIPKTLIHDAINELGEKRHKLSSKHVQEILDATDKILASQAKRAPQ
jgi:predicted nucleic acid-binding protein